MKRVLLGTSGLLLAVVGGWVIAQETLPAVGDKQPAAKPTVADQYSYALGLDIGSNFRRYGTPLSVESMMAGLQDGLGGGKPKFDQETCFQAMQQLQVLMSSKEEAMAQNAAAENLKLGEAFLTKNKAQEGIKVTKSGLQYKVIKAGTGATPGPNDTVRCEYRGTLIDGREFDASNGSPIEFRVRGVISGWTEALQLMKVGAKWQLFIPAELAYGNQQKGPLIAPGSTLVFDIELLGIVGK